MADDDRDENAARLRGDIAAGKATGKRPGFDPAAAPIETDAEAGGTPASAEEVRIARGTQVRPEAADLDVPYGSAMRSPENEGDAADHGGGMASIALIAAAAMAVIAVIVLIMMT